MAVYEFRSSRKEWLEEISKSYITNIAPDNALLHVYEPFEDYRPKRGDVVIALVRRADFVSRSMWRFCEVMGETILLSGATISPVDDIEIVVGLQPVEKQLYEGRAGYGDNLAAEPTPVKVEIIGVVVVAYLPFLQ